MSTETSPFQLGPDASGMLLSPDEFDAAEFERGWSYELVRGVLIVTPPALEQERDPNEELGRLLRNYQDEHPQGTALDKTLPEHNLVVGSDRRRADRVVWTGLGRRPRRGEVPSIVVEFVSAGRRSRKRDYDEKRIEYLKIGVQEYWIIDRFQRTMTVHFGGDSSGEPQVVAESETYTTSILPGFELPLARLFSLADDWED